LRRGAGSDGRIGVTTASLVQGALRRERFLVIACLLAIVVGSWAYLLAGAGMGMPMGEMLMPMGAASWTPGYAVIVLVMWVVMMAAMMLPSAAPMILLYATIAQRRSERGELAAGAGSFVCGYLAVWSLFSVAAAALQFSLEEVALLSPLMKSSSVTLAAAVLVGAGLYQFTPLKQACLRQCQSPLDFVVTHWRPGSRGAFGMGFRHGVYCVGCCWLVMMLLFVGGVMNLAWIAGIAVFVLVEKVAPAGHWIGRGAGAVLVAWGAATLFAAFF
jgi:predicted metal-binding membrane protein